MATAPVKSQPLHNFSLSFLKWNTKSNHTSNNHHQRCRRSADPPPLAPPHPLADRRSAAIDSDSSGPDNRQLPLGCRTARGRPAFVSTSSSPLHKSQKQVAAENIEDEDREKADEGDAEVEGSVTQRPWNLRPRRNLYKNCSGSDIRTGELLEENGSMGKSVRPREGERKDNDKGKEKAKAAKFWIALSKEEIEEDIYALTGSKPNRRPRKRPKTVQKQLEGVFPGLWLVGVTADAYRILDTPAKR